MSKALSALVFAGDGINCELETAEAFRKVGFETKIAHINDLIAEGVTLDQLCSSTSVVALPGGFSFGDDIRSGSVLALKISHGLKWDFNKYVERGGLVLGICNGFQALIRLGVFGQMISITSNQSHRFVNRWVKVSPKGSRCAWLKGIGTIDLPVRHAEGRLVVERTKEEEVRSKFERQEMLCLQYDGKSNPNGSVFDAAGLCDATGRVFGLMPHPEAFVRWTSHPEWTGQPSRAGAPGDGLLIFENAFKSLR